MPEAHHPPLHESTTAPPSEAERLTTGAGEVVTEVRRQENALKAGALQSAIFNSASFSSIATDANGVIQIFNVGAERMRMLDTRRRSVRR